MDKDDVVPVLKTCPFCGDLPQVVFSGTYRVQCSDCGANGPPFPSSEGAAKLLEPERVRVGSDGWVCVRGAAG